MALYVFLSSDGQQDNDLKSLAQIQILMSEKMATHSSDTMLTLPLLPPPGVEKGATGTSAQSLVNLPSELPL